MRLNECVQKYWTFYSISAFKWMQEFDDLIFFLQDLEDRDLESDDMELKTFLNNAWLKYLVEVYY